MDYKHPCSFVPRDTLLARYMLSSYVRLSQVGVLQKCLNLGSHKQRRNIAKGQKISAEFERGHVKQKRQK